MVKKQEEPKIVLEREYTIPLRRSWLKVPKYKRANKAIKSLKEFLLRHMKVYDKDLKKVKVDVTLNNELRFRGIRKPPGKIRVKAQKSENDIIKVQLVEIPDPLKFKKSKEEKKRLEIKKKIEARKAAREAEKETAKKEESEEVKEKEAASREETMRLAEEKAKEIKHISKETKIVEHKRKALAK